MRSLQNQIGRYVTVQWGMGVAALLLLVGFYFMGIHPADQQRAANVAAIDSERRELTDGLARARQLPQVEKDVAALQNRLEHFDKKLPRKPDMDQFMRDITRVSDQSQLKGMTVQPGSPKRSDLFSEMPISLNFSGDFPNVMGFLQQTEDMQRLTRVRSLSIKTKDQAKGTVEVDLSMSIYFADQ